jgi:hypothetical protein
MEDMFSMPSVPRCYKKNQLAVAEAGDSSGTKKTENIRRWKPLQSNGSEDVTMDTSVCARMWQCTEKCSHALYQRVQ